jgi:hypothetical protein
MRLFAVRGSREGGWERADHLGHVRAHPWYVPQFSLKSRLFQELVVSMNRQVVKQMTIYRKDFRLKQCWCCSRSVPPFRGDFAPDDAWCSMPPNTRSIHVTFCKAFFFQGDIELMVDMGMDAYRFSIAWSRIFPSTWFGTKTSRNAIPFWIINFCFCLICEWLP